MNKEIEIPEGYEARIEGNKVVLELRESEDEKIRKQLINFASTYEFWKAEQLTKEEVVAYLEKQKEQPTNEEMLRTLRTEYEKGVADTIAKYEQKEQKLAEWSDEDEKIMQTMIKEGDLKQSEIEWLKNLKYRLQKEHKPILEVFGFRVGDAVKLKDGDGRKHIIKSFEEVKGVHGPNFYHVEFEDNSARDGIYPGKKYPNGYYTQMEKFEEEQKLSTEETELNSIAFLEQMGYTCIPPGKEQKPGGPYDPFKDDQFKKGYELGVLDAGRLQKVLPPAEWSEEDEKILNELLDHCNTENATWYNWLKSLRPQPKQEDRYMEGYTKGYAEGYKKAEENYNNSVVYRMPIPITQQLDPNVVIPSTTDGTSSPEVECKRK